MAFCVVKLYVHKQLTCDTVSIIYTTLFKYITKHHYMSIIKLITHYFISQLLIMECLILKAKIHFWSWIRCLLVSFFYLIGQRENFSFLSMCFKCHTWINQSAAYFLLKSKTTLWLLESDTQRQTGIYYHLGPKFLQYFTSDNQ